jgi:hypothetical protein
LLDSMKGSLISLLKYWVKFHQTCDVCCPLQYTSLLTTTWENIFVYFITHLG